MGCSSRSKRCFTKMWGFSNRFHPPHPPPLFFFPFENVWKIFHRILDSMGKSGGELEGNYANISLPDWMRTAASSRSFFVCLKFCRATWPLHAGETETRCVCVCDYWFASLKQNRLIYATGSLFRAWLKQVAVGWIPLNSLCSYCSLRSPALNPRRSNCCYRTLCSYEDSPGHNTLRVTAGTVVTNLHLFHNLLIKKCINI